MLLACQPTHHTLPPALITPPPRSGRRPCDVADFSIHALGALDPTKLQSSLPGDSAPAQHPTRHHSSAQSPLEALSPAGPPPRSGTRPCDVDCLCYHASLRLATLTCCFRPHACTCSCRYVHVCSCYPCSCPRDSSLPLLHHGKQLQSPIPPTTALTSAIQPTHRRRDTSMTLDAINVNNGLAPVSPSTSTISAVPQAIFSKDSPRSAPTR